MIDRPPPPPHGALLKGNKETSEQEGLGQEGEVQHHGGRVLQVLLPQVGEPAHGGAVDDAVIRRPADVHDREGSSGELVGSQLSGGTERLQPVQLLSDLEDAEQLHVLHVGNQQTLTRVHRQPDVRRVEDGEVKQAEGGSLHQSERSSEVTLMKKGMKLSLTPRLSHRDFSSFLSAASRLSSTSSQYPNSGGRLDRLEQRRGMMAPVCFARKFKMSSFRIRPTHVVLHGEAAHRGGRLRLVTFDLLVGVLLSSHGRRLHHYLSVLLTVAGLGLDVHQRFPHQRRGVHLVVKPRDDSVVAAGDGDGRLVALHLADTVELRHLIALLHVPEGQTATTAHHSFTVTSMMPSPIRRNTVKEPLVTAAISTLYRWRHSCTPLSAANQRGVYCSPSD
ncbi:hypothetical protein F7725_027160 [Dissostichus mawsoni]|uniref:Uncharacterized protein n=1 Tax=Dissostichus mawsoni TaxID=36200 RepID=A0A7J5XC45_DISMA|nr:hypothetical protein F7725_027160 [Dissostichus mawsoni]